MIKVGIWYFSRVLRMFIYTIIIFFRCEVIFYEVRDNREKMQLTIENVFALCGEEN